MATGHISSNFSDSCLLVLYPGEERKGLRGKGHALALAVMSSSNLLEEGPPLQTHSGRLASSKQGGPRFTNPELEVGAVSRSRSGENRMLGTYKELHLVERNYTERPLRVSKTD